MGYKLVECVVPCKITYVVDGENAIQAAKEMLPNCVELEASHELLWESEVSYTEKELPENWERDYAIKRTIQLYEQKENSEENDLTAKPKKRKMSGEDKAAELLDIMEEL